MAINTATVTLADIKAAETAELLKTYNKITGKNIKAFHTRLRAEQQIWKAIQTLAPNEDINSREIETVEKEKSKKHRMKFRFAPRSSFSEIRETSKRFKVFKMLDRENGATFTQIQKALEWDAQTAYEGIRLVHIAAGYGMWSIDEGNEIRIYLVREPKVYTKLLNESKAA